MDAYPNAPPSCSVGSMFGLRMLLVFSGAPGKPEGAAVGPDPEPGAPGPPGPPTGPPTGPPDPYPPLLGGRFWFSPLADWVSNRSI